VGVTLDDGLTLGDTELLVVDVIVGVTLVVCVCVALTLMLVVTEHDGDVVGTTLQVPLAVIDIDAVDEAAREAVLLGVTLTLGLGVLDGQTDEVTVLLGVLDGVTLGDGLRLGVMDAVSLRVGVLDGVADGDALMHRTVASSVLPTSGQGSSKLHRLQTSCSAKSAGGRVFSATSARATFITYLATVAFLLQDVLPRQAASMTDRLVREWHDASIVWLRKQSAQVSMHTHVVTACYTVNGISARLLHCSALTSCRRAERREHHLRDVRASWAAPRAHVVLEHRLAHAHARAPRCRAGCHGLRWGD